MAMAEEARAAGNEGRARVCARRAAGLAAQHRLEPSGLWKGRGSALDALRALAATDGLLPALREAAGRLTRRVTEDFTLPHAQDPLADAQVIIGECLPATET